MSDTIRDRLVCGLQSEVNQKYLWTESNLTIERAIEVSTLMTKAAKEERKLSASFQLHKVHTEKRKIDKLDKLCYHCKRSAHQTQ